LNPISNPALIPPGGLSTPPAAPARASKPADGIEPAAGAARNAPVEAPSGQSFADALKQAGGGESLQFSRHALARVQRRGIQLDSATLGRLSEGVTRAAGKGSRDSLVLIDGTAFVVSVSNRTVVTAVGSEHMKDNVFTNIDSAVIA
jgi:flagellar operon protein